MSHERFRTLIERAPIAISVSRDGMGIYGNQKLAQVFGLRSPDEWIGRPIVEHFAARSREESRERMRRRALGLPVTTEFESVGLRPDGSEFPFHAAVAPIQLPDGPANVSFITDITERKTTETNVARLNAELEAALSWQRQIFEGSRDAIFLSDEDGRFVAVNSAATELTGFSREELLTMRIPDLHEESDLAAYCAFQRRILDGERILSEAPIRRKDGCKVAVEFNNSVVISGRRLMHTTGRDVGDRKRALEELRVSEERFRALIERAPIAIGLGRKAVTVYANPKYLEMYGFESVDEVRGRSIGEQFAPSCRAEIEEQARQRAEGRPVPSEYEAIGQRKDGSMFPVHVATTIVQLADGPCTAGFLTDITQRKRAEEALRESEARYRTLVDASPDAITMTDLQGTLILSNPQNARLYGYDDPQAMQGINVFDLVASEDRQRAMKDAQKTLDAGGVTSIEYMLLRKDGSRFPAGVSTSLLRDAGGTPAAVIGITRDISKRKQAEEALRVSEERYRRIVDTANEGIWSVNWKLRTTFVNDAFARMLGFAPEEMLGAPAETFTFPEDREEFRKHMSIRRKGISEQYERRFRRKDGRECWCLVSGAPILDSDGRFAGSFGMLTDVTERRHLEEQLRQSQKMEAVGRLAGGVAHDFNNLLTVILGYSDVLLQGLEPGPLLEATQEVRRAGERAAALTRQLLAFSRKQTLVPEVLDLGNVVSGLSTMVERLIGEDVKVSVVVSPGLGRVKADRGQLEQVVMNLAVNARDAMPKGGSLIFELQNVVLDDAYAATHVEVEPGPYVLLAISDTGTGMDAETQKRIFEPFFTTKETGKGTGLGLSTVYGIVRQSGGSIDVYSEPGQGTTFKVYLPRFAGNAAVPRAVSAINPALRDASETVLVVEDEAAIRQLTKLILQKAGYTVLLAESPVAAERIAGSHPGPIHLMLTDVVMPGMRGPELAERLLRLRPDLRVLYMSGYTDNAIAHHGLLDAGTEFLQKPFTPAALGRKVREVLDTPG